MLDHSLLDDDSVLYEEAPDLLRFRTDSPSIQLLTDWYQTRAKDIDRYSRQVVKTGVVEMPLIKEASLIFSSTF